jgi:hypothetical protein
MTDFDQEFLKIMSLYKRLRLDPEKTKESDQLLVKAGKLRKEGKVSQGTIEAVRYL